MATSAEISRRGSGLARRELVGSCRRPIPIVTHNARSPAKNEIERVAERLWQDAFGGAAGMSWQKVQPDSSAHQIVERLALAGFNFSIQPERMGSGSATVDTIFRLRGGVSRRYPALTC